ncbi:MAG: CPBP family intramembrane metalloprotease [Propionibacteriaceae bacterium]|nr:CPBP family intramembrane metalloprotease [Propionibacteriaceae bacterium]
MLLVCMLIPLLVLLGFCAARQVRLGELGLRPLKWRYWLVGFGVALLAQAVVFAASLWAIDYPAFSAAGGQWKLEGMSTLFGQPNPPLLFVANTLLTMVVATLLTVPQALGEEAAWRGYLQPKFISRFGPVRGIALLGVVWGLFHLPICLAGYNFPASPILGGFVFMIGGTIGLGGLFGWLRLKSGSVWPAAVGHAAWNISCSVTYFAVPRIDVTAYYALQTAVILAVGGVFWWLLAREATAGQAEPS